LRVNRLNEWNAVVAAWYVDDGVVRTVDLILLSLDGLVLQVLVSQTVRDDLLGLCDTVGLGYLDLRLLLLHLDQLLRLLYLYIVYLYLVALIR
jgi:hypothetical protein